jgi:Protein of unknown function DUF262
MPTSTHKSIASLVAEVDSGEILLPEIQRGYVWKAGQIAYLLDSLYRGYPTGSMLLWKPSEEVQIRGLAIAPSGQAAAHSPLYLLDGQQRLTSLHRREGAVSTRTLARRPRRAWRQRVACPRSRAIASVASPGARAVVAGSPFADASRRRRQACSCPRAAQFWLTAKHVPRIRPNERQGRRPGVGSRSGKRPGKGILGRVGLEQAPVTTAVVP